MTIKLAPSLTLSDLPQNQCQYLANMSDDQHIYNSLSNKLKKHKNVLYKSHLSSFSPNNGSLLKKTKSLLRHKTILPLIQHQNSNIAVSAQDKAELPALYFSNVFKPHSILPDISHLDQVNKFITLPLPMALPAKHTTPKEISSIIKTLKTNKSPGHDQISNKIIKNIPAKTIIQLTHIYNATLHLSYFPATWKSAVIIPILKPNKPPDKVDLYRPISLLRKILLKSYIENRSFSVKIDSTLSGSHDILAGVPQRSNIIPFLYILFTEDIPTTENTHGHVC